MCSMVSIQKEYLKKITGITIVFLANNSNCSLKETKEVSVAHTSTLCTITFHGLLKCNGKLKVRIHYFITTCTCKSKQQYLSERYIAKLNIQLPKKQSMSFGTQPFNMVLVYCSHPVL